METIYVAGTNTEATKAAIGIDQPSPYGFGTNDEMRLFDQFQKFVRTHERGIAINTSRSSLRIPSMTGQSPISIHWRYPSMTEQHPQHSQFGLGVEPNSGTASPLGDSKPPTIINGDPGVDTHPQSVADQKTPSVSDSG